MCLAELIMVEGRIAGAQGGGAETLAQVLEGEGEKLARGFRCFHFLHLTVFVRRIFFRHSLTDSTSILRILTCLNHCRNVQVKEVELLTLVGPLVAAEEVVVEVVVEVGAGLVTLDRRTFLIPTALTSPSTSKLVLPSQTLESHGGPSRQLSKYSLTI